MSVSLEIVVRLFFPKIAYLSCLSLSYIMKPRKDGGDYERKENSFIF